MERVPTHPAKSVFICASPWPISSSLETNVRQVLLRIPIRGDWSLGPLGDVSRFRVRHSTAGVVPLRSILAAASAQIRRRLHQRIESRRRILDGVCGRHCAHSVDSSRLKSLICRSLATEPCSLLASSPADGPPPGEHHLPGADPTFAREIAVWIVLSGVVGARLFHLVQYRERVFAGCESVADYVKASVNLPDGGLGPVRRNHPRNHHVLRHVPHEQSRPAEIRRRDDSGCLCRNRVRSARLLPQRLLLRKRVFASLGRSVSERQRALERSCAARIPHAGRPSDNVTAPDANLQLD